MVHTNRQGIIFFIYKTAREEDAYWFLILRGNISGSDDKAFLQQKKMIDDVNKERNSDYQVPKIIHVATGVAIAFVSTGEWVFKASPWMVTRTTEMCGPVSQYCVGSSGGCFDYQ